MSNFVYKPDPEKSETRLREKQCKCPHTCFKCPSCGLYRDNVFNGYKANIEVLQAMLGVYEELLSVNNISHIKYEQLIADGIMDVFLKEKMKHYNRTECL